MTDIAFPAQVAKIATLADGGLRVSLDLPESAILPVAELMVCKRDGQVLDVVCKVKTVIGCNDETEKDPKGSGPEVDSRRITIRRDKQSGG